jgi:hypothetical protein
MVIADAKKSAEIQIGVGNIPGGIINHEAFDRTHPLFVRAIDRGSLDSIAGDPRAGTSFGTHGILLG